MRHGIGDSEESLKVHIAKKHESDLIPFLKGLAFNKAKKLYEKLGKVARDEDLWKLAEGSVKEVLYGTYFSTPTESTKKAMFNMANRLLEPRKIFLEGKTTNCPICNKDVNLEYKKKVKCQKRQAERNFQHMSLENTQILTTTLGMLEKKSEKEVIETVKAIAKGKKAEEKLTEEERDNLLNLWVMSLKKKRN